MTLNTKTFAVLLGSLALAASLAASPADACGRKGWKSADGATVYGWKHHKRWKHWKHAMR